MHLCICICLQTYAYVSLCIYVSVSMYLCIYVSMYLCIYVCSSTHACKCKCKYINAYPCTSMYLCLCMCVGTQTHTHTHTYTHMHSRTHNTHTHKLLIGHKRQLAPRSLQILRHRGTPHILLWRVCLYSRARAAVVHGFVTASAPLPPTHLYPPHCTSVDLGNYYPVNEALCRRHRVKRDIYDVCVCLNPVLLFVTIALPHFGRLPRYFRL